MPKTDTLAKQVGAYLDHLVVERGLSRHTVAAYRRDLRRYVEHLASHGVDDLATVDPSDITAHLAVLSGADGGAPQAASSVARSLAAVRGLHAFATTEGWANVDPSRDVAVPKQPQRLPKALPLADIQRMMDACDPQEPSGLRDRALLELLYGTGARISEVVALDVDDVWPALRDPELGVRLWGKGGKERIVPLGSFARDALDAWLVRGRPVFAAKATHHPPALLLNVRGARLSRTSAFNATRACAARADVTAVVSPHTLRHSFATHLLDGGADVRVVQELLGHASVTTTQIYTKVTSEHLREVYLASHPRAY